MSVWNRERVHIHYEYYSQPQKKVQDHYLQIKLLYHALAYGAHAPSLTTRGLGTRLLLDYHL